MSAWMISDAHADFLATAFLRLVDAGADPQLIGRELLEENARSLEALYADRHGVAQDGRDQAAAYTYRRWTGAIEPSNVLKQARCAQYQSCEHGDAWTASASARRLAQLIVPAGGYEADLSDEFPWGIDEHPEQSAELDPDRAPGRIGERLAQVIELRSNAALRPAAGNTDDVDGLALFDHVRQPSLI
jgi:hypothetical protein